MSTKAISGTTRASRAAKTTVDPAREALKAARELERQEAAAVREAFLAGDRSLPQFGIIQEVMDGVKNLKEKIAAAKTKEEFKACYDIADVELYKKASRIEWNDCFAPMFLTDTCKWCSDAMEWIDLLAAHPEIATLETFSKEWRTLTSRVGTESLEQACEWALGAIESFEKSMF
jgi:hypothetical protein